jgi:hypothetical protein
MVLDLEPELTAWRKSLSPCIHQHLPLASTLNEIQDKLAGVQGFLGTLNHANPREFAYAVKVGEMAANYAHELLVHFGLTYSDDPAPSPINPMQAKFVVSNLQGIVQEFILLHQDSLVKNYDGDIVKPGVDLINTDISILSAPLLPDETNVLKIDRDTFSVYLSDLTLKLGYTNEFKVLEVLNKNFGLFVSHSKIIEEVWDNQGESTNIQRAVSNLRRKLKDAGMNQVLINTENGHYMLSLS